jgi:hypothetical protein
MVLGKTIFGFGFNILDNLYVLGALRYKPGTGLMRMHEPPLEDVTGRTCVLLQVSVHHLGRAPRLTLTREVNVVNVGEVLAHRHPGTQAAVGGQVLGVEGSVHFGKDQNFAKTRKLLIQDVHVKILKNIK